MRKDQIENPWHEQRLNYMFKPKEIKEKEKKVKDEMSKKKKYEEKMGVKKGMEDKVNE